MPTVPTPLDSGEIKWLFSKATGRENSCSDPPPSTGDSQRKTTRHSARARGFTYLCTTSMLYRRSTLYIRVREKGGIVSFLYSIINSFRCHLLNNYQLYLILMLNVYFTTQICVILFCFIHIFVYLCAVINSITVCKDSKKK